MSASLSVDDAKNYLNFATLLADDAARVTAPLFRQPLPIEVKSDASPFTQADCNAEKAICETIEKYHPEHGIIGEEFGRRRADAEFVWVIDPIDGTRSFIGGSPLYSTLIVLLAQGVPVVSVLDFPMLPERYSALNLPGLSEARLNGKVCRTVDAAVPLAKAIGGTTTAALQENATDMRMQQFMRRCGQVRLGGDAFSYALVGAGFSHLAFDYLMQPYDYLPLLPFIEAAGGVVSDWEGRALAPFDTRADNGGAQTVLASANRGLHDEALAAFAALA